MQQQVTLAVGRQAASGPWAESGTHRPVDGLPAKAGQPDQRRPEASSQGRRRWRHVCKHKQRHRLGGQPGLLSRQLGGQLSFQGRQGGQGCPSVSPQGIGLHHAHVPTTGAVFKGHGAQGGAQKGLR